MLLFPHLERGRSALLSVRHQPTVSESFSSIQFPLRAISYRCVARVVCRFNICESKHFLLLVLGRVHRLPECITFAVQATS